MLWKYISTSQAVSVKASSFIDVWYGFMEAFRDESSKTLGLMDFFLSRSVAADIFSMITKSRFLQSAHEWRILVIKPLLSIFIQLSLSATTSELYHKTQYHAQFY